MEQPRQDATSNDALENAREAELHTALTELSDLIRRTREELASLRVEDISALHVPSATDELDAVIAATEQATNIILDSAEELSELADSLPDSSAGPVMDSVTRIYEACNFQDITGQRIGKVVTTLRTIEVSVSKMLGVFEVATGDQTGPSGAAAEIDSQSRGPHELDESDLLNGPQLDGQAKLQDEIDALFEKG